MEIDEDDHSASASYTDYTPRDTPDPEDMHQIHSHNYMTPKQELIKQQKLHLADKRKHLANSKARDKRKRDEYLLGLTELFRHFIEDEGLHAPLSPSKKVKHEQMIVDTPSRYNLLSLYCYHLNLLSLLVEDIV